MPAPYDDVVIVGDVLHNRNIVFRHFFDLITEPIRQVTGRAPRQFLEVGGNTPGSPAAGFLGQLGELSQETWGKTCFFGVPEAARRIFLDQMPANALVIAMEAVPWMADICNREGIDYLDIRMSPLRYGSDLYMAIRSSSAGLNERIDRWAISESRLRLEAGRLKARVRHHHEQMKLHNVLVQDLSGCCVYLGQMPMDAALFADDGHYVRCEEFAEAIRGTAANRKVFYKAHPYAGAFGEQEAKTLEAILGQPLSPCFANAYQLLSCHPGIALVGLSSGLLQEAAYFDVSATVLFRSFCKIAPQASEQASVQVDYQDFIAPDMWSHLLGRSDYSARPSDTLRVPNACRESVGIWWDYGKVMTWSNALFIEAYERSGGKVLRDRVVQLEAAVAALRPDAAAARAEAEVLTFLRDKLGIERMLHLGAPHPALPDIAAALGIAYIHAEQALSAPPSGGGGFDLAWTVGHLEHLPPEQLAASLAALAPCQTIVCMAPEKTGQALAELLAHHGFAQDEFLTQTIRAKSKAHGGPLAEHGLLFRKHGLPGTAE